MKNVAIIYWKNIQFDVVLPENMVWPFALAFGKEFSMDEGTPKPIDGYFLQGGYHVEVSVPAAKEQDFYKFLHSFCKEHGLHVRSYDLRPGQG